MRDILEPNIRQSEDSKEETEEDNADFIHDSEQQERMIKEHESI